MALRHPVRAISGYRSSVLWITGWLALSFTMPIAHAAERPEIAHYRVIPVASFDSPGSSGGDEFHAGAPDRNILSPESCRNSIGQAIQAFQVVDASVPGCPCGP